METTDREALYPDTGERSQGKEGEALTRCARARLHSKHARAPNHRVVILLLHPKQDSGPWLLAAWSGVVSEAAGLGVP